MVQAYTPTQFISLGLEAACKDDGWKKWMPHRQEGAFISEYNVHPKAMSNIWHDLQTTPFAQFRIDVTIVLPISLLVVYRWAKRYETEADLSRRFGFGEVRIREILRTVSFKIAALRKIKVRYVYCLFY